MMTDRIILNEETIKNNIIIVTGASRSGKTLLCRILASSQNAEWIEEPYDLGNYIRMYGMGKLDPEVFRMLFNSSVYELVNSMVLLRNANFRPDDLSSIWRYKSASDVFSRLHDIRTRDDVKQYIKCNETWFILDLPEILQFLPVIYDCFDKLIVINVVRNGYDVADACFKKGWFTDEDELNMHNCIYRNNNGKLVPWFIDTGNENAYSVADPYERALMYWIGINRNVIDTQHVDIMVRYEDLCDNGAEIIRKLMTDIGLRSTSITSALCTELKQDYDDKLDNRLMQFSNYDRDSFTAIMNRFGYSI